MPDFRKTFELGSFEKKPKVPYEELNTPFKKETYEKGPLDKEKNREDDPAQELSQEDYDEIIELLRSKKRGGADIHLSQINIAKLSETELGKESLRLFKLHNENKLEEEAIRSLLADAKEGSNEYNFGAMLLNWSLDRTEVKKAEEKEKLKEEARKKLEELKGKNPHIVAYVDNINISLLGGLDLKAIKNIEHINVGDYKDNLKEYFGNKTKGKEGQEITIIKEDPRFKFYCSLKGILNLGPGSPEEFLNN